MDRTHAAPAQAPSGIHDFTSRSLECKEAAEFAATLLLMILWVVRFSAKLSPWTGVYYLCIRFLISWFKPDIDKACQWIMEDQRGGK